MIEDDSNAFTLVCEVIHSNSSSFDTFINGGQDRDDDDDEDCEVAAVQAEDCPGGGRIIDLRVMALVRDELL